MVIMGNHRDAWVFGAVDPNSATAPLMDIARVFSELRNKGLFYMHMFITSNFTTTYTYKWPCACLSN